MHRYQLPKRPCAFSSGRVPRRRFRHGAKWTVALMVALAPLAVRAQEQPHMDLSADAPWLTPEQRSHHLPDANAQAALHDIQAKQRSFDAANAERKKQLTDDSARLLTLAMALKAEVDRTDKDVLSTNVLRKADEIEKLAEIVKEKMKMTVGGS